MKRLLVLFLVFFSISIVYSAGADIVIDSSTSWPPGTYDYGTITVNNSATLTLEGNTTSGTGVIINADNIYVEAGSSISANGQGYPSATGGYARGLGDGGGYYSNRPGGAGYGGLGADGYGGSYLPGPTYGSYSQPTHLGSSGANWNSLGGGEGGGAIKLNVSGTLTIDGSITANGASGKTIRSGGGSGGSIWLIADTISGSGSLSSNGGNSATGIDSTQVGGGGGGRIAFHCSEYQYLGNIFVSGGTGYGVGGTGTIYQSSTCAGTPTYVDPTPSTNLKLYNPSQFVFNITDSGRIISGCEIDIDGTNYTMTYSGGYCNLTYIPNSTSSINQLSFQGYYQASSVWYPIEKRTISIYPSKNNNQNFPSIGIGSLIISIMIFILVLFI